MLHSIVALAAFIPVIIGMGGNIGTQSSTIVVRGIATGRINFGNDLKLIFKELSVGLILGGLYGFLLGTLAFFFFKDAPATFGLVVGLSICSSMIIATSIGTIVPLLLRKLDIDPAIATGPFVTTSIDILGVGIYFLIASSFLIGIGIDDIGKFLEHFFLRASCFCTFVDAMCFIETNEWSGFFFINTQPLTDELFIVIAPLDESGLADVAHLFLTGRICYVVVYFVTLGAVSSANQPLDYLGFIKVHFNRYF